MKRFCSDPRIALGLLLVLSFTAEGRGQQVSPVALDRDQGIRLAEFMCGQLPNVGTILERIQLPAPGDKPGPAPPEPFIMDDVYDALMRLGPYSLPCLTDRLLDTRWMPDPRSEPLLGVPVVGDVAYMILTDMGVHDVFPEITGKKPGDLRMDDYFLWPSVGDHRRRLQRAVRVWVAQHPDCCGSSPMPRKTAPTRLKFRMSPGDLEMARIEFARIRPGMSPSEVLRIKGKPDAIDPGYNAPEHLRNGLLGLCANDHNENLAYIYFTERWADEVARRDPLRDRYVIAFFSAEGKLTRTFSNVPAIPPMFPASATVWQHLMWGELVNKK